MPQAEAGIRTHGWCHTVGNEMVELTKTIEWVIETLMLLKLPLEMPIYAENVRCARCWNSLRENAAISGNMRRQSHSLELKWLNSGDGDDNGAE